jgi:hypothetical protein
MVASLAGVDAVLPQALRVKRQSRQNEMSCFMVVQ